jgi:two-component system, OmpR family, phosphate regulon response regulator PhoB
VHTGDPRPPTVLLVEDDPAALRFYADALRASGFLVEEASSGAEALRSAGAAGPSIIVADLGLPDFDGFEVCRQVKLRPETRQVPVIAITGRAMALRDIELAEEVGFNAVLIKPCPPEALVAAVGKALNGSRPAS